MGVDYVMYEKTYGHVITYVNKYNKPKTNLRIQRY